MGKVRIGKVKSVSNELVGKYPNVFSTDFEVNKKLVYQYSDIRSKRLNNRVAGYVTRLRVSQKKREEALRLEEAEIASKEAEAQAPAVEMATEETVKEPLPEAAAPVAQGTEEQAKGGDAEEAAGAEEATEEEAEGQEEGSAKTE